jgi:septal ring factor EnvC (AmiA/AmiB activator)
MELTQILESVLPALIAAAVSGYIAKKMSAAKTEVLIAGMKAGLEANDKTTTALQIAIEKRNTEMEGVHRELKELKNVTDIHSREIAEFHAVLARIEAKLDIIIGGTGNKIHGRD